MGPFKECIYWEFAKGSVVRMLVNRFYTDVCDRNWLTRVDEQTTKSNVWLSLAPEFGPLVNIAHTDVLGLERHYYQY